MAADARKGAGAGANRAPKPYRQRHDGFTPAKKRKFFRALKKCGCLRDSARVAGVSTNTVRRHRDKWPRFDAAVETALAIASVDLDMVAWKRAVEGVEETMIRDGKVAWVKIKPSDSILRLLMQGANPKKYGRIGQRPAKAATKKLKAKLRAELEEEMKAARAREMKEAQERLEARLSEMNRRMGGDG